MKSFKEYKNELYEQKFIIKKSSEKVNTVVATFGRFNPPTLGHGKLFDKLKELSGTNKADYFIFASQTHDLNKKGKDDKNPLDYDTKMKYLKMMFPEHSRKFVYNNDRSKNNEFSALSMLHDAGYDNVIWVVGGDRYDEMEEKPETNRLREFNGKEGQKHGYYNFKNIKIENAGKRDPKSSGVEGMSSSKLKAAAREGDFDSFSKGLPSTFKDATGLYNAVRKNLANIKEAAPRVDDVREAYISGNLFRVGDNIIAKSQSYVIVERHSNFVSAKSPSGEIKKFFLNQIELDESKVLEYGTTRAANIYKRDTPGQSLSDAKRFVESEKKSETWEAGYERRVVKVTDPEKKAEGFLWRIKGKEKDNLTIKYYKTKPSFEEFSAQMRRVAGHEFGK